MIKNIIQSLNALVPLRFCVWALLLIPIPAQAWTSANLSEVHVALEVAQSGPSRVVTQARFEVTGGSFHGFDLAPLADAELVKEECIAVLDDGRRYPLSFRKLYDGRIRVVLADKASVKHSGVNFTLVHTTDLFAVEALRSYGGRARLDWTPLIWDEGTNLMTVEVALPGKISDADATVDQAVSRDYDVEITEDRIRFVKHRTVRWYPMQLVVDFNPSLVASLAEETTEDNSETDKAIAAYQSTAHTNPPAPMHIALLPLVAVLLGILLLMRKSWRTTRALEDLNLQARHRLLPNTGWPIRLLLSLAAAGLGLGAQWYGSIAASIPPLVIVAALWIVRRESGSIRPRPGGDWRQMTDEDIFDYRALARAYKSRRRSWIDITTIGGVVTFLIALAALGYALIISRGNWPRIAWATIINGLIMTVPAWFANVRSELPVDATIESFSTLRRWRNALSRMVGSKAPGADASFWVREDAKGAIEVRLRVEPAPAGLKGIEVAGEVIRSGSTIRCRKAVVLRMEPGTEAARRLATCPYAVEHHLTPDLEEEIIVLRNRRGRTDKGLTPLRSALGILMS